MSTNCAPAAGRPPLGSEPTHSYLAGIVSHVARSALGDEAADRIRIMPVKCSSDMPTKSGSRTAATAEKNQHKGWKADVTFVDSTPRRR
ncbi:MAG: hypothetical protein IH624_03415 [Phycisphaerae bacterium]|nr:hypothetical protein [Phycisphaerae bacterium]